MDDPEPTRPSAYELFLIAVMTVLVVIAVVVQLSLLF